MSTSYYMYMYATCCESHTLCIHKCTYYTLYVQGSVIDMESEISRLESQLREKDEQLSSFKTILEEKELLLQQHLENENTLSKDLEQANELRTSSDLRIRELESKLVASGDLIKERESEIAAQREVYTELTTQHQELQSNLKGAHEQLIAVQVEVHEAKTARESFEKELWNKMGEISSLGHQLEDQKVTIAEKDSTLARQRGEIEQLRETVQDLQSSNEVLQLSIDGDRRTSADKLTSSLQQIHELEERVTELQSNLVEKENEVGHLQQLSQQLQNNLLVSEEKLQQSESSSKQELSKLEMSFGHERDEAVETVRDLERKLQKKQDELKVVKESSAKDLDLRDEEIAEKEQAIDRLEKDAESREIKCSDLQSQLAKSSGALEFAQKELSSRDCTIKTLSQTLEEKKASIGKLEAELAQTKSENADRLTEVMQRNEQTLQSKIELETSLKEAKHRLEEKERELVAVRDSLEKAELVKASMDKELLTVKGRLDGLLRENESARVEAETLRGQVEGISEIKETLTKERTSHENELAEMKLKLSQLSVQVSELQQKLSTAKQQLHKVMKEKQDEIAKRESMEAELSQYERENRQMKEQFDSAVKLMESKSSEQVAAINRAQMELGQKESTCTSLQEQITAEMRKNNELKERVTKLSADYKVSLDRSRQLEQEKLQFQHRIAELTAKHSQLEQAFSDAMIERESLQSEHQASLRGVQEHEARVLNLTGQVAQLAHEKQSLESQLRELSKQLVSTQQSNIQISTELSELKSQTHGVENWEREKLVSV